MTLAPPSFIVRRMITSGTKIAIIGSGISGMGAAYGLHQAGHNITLFEKNGRLGGHSRTINITENNTKIPVDTGFIVFNYRNYPHLTAMFDHLGVAVEKSDMSFGVDINNGWLQYSSKNIFRRPQNIFRVAYWKMLFDVIKFNKYAAHYLNKSTDVTIRQCLDEMGMGKWFRDYYLQAMGAAIWSCPISKIQNFPAKTFIRFFQNHGLLTVTDQPQWYTVSGGSIEYIKKITANFQNKIKLSSGVKKVERHENGVTIITDDGTRSKFDHVIFACHADQAFKMLDNPTNQEKEIISAFTYQDNKVVTHRDLNFMPTDKSCWASWVYLSQKLEDKNDSVSLSYWMNNLQNFKTDRPVIITLNPETMPDESLIDDVHHFDHPVFNRAAIDEQEKIDSLQGLSNCWFAGAYQRYGFHEDGLLSAVNVLTKMGVDIPWK
jgi:predicted NAD/FAD-binding protein